MSLKETLMAKNAGEGIKFMENRTKGELEEILNKEVILRDYDFINGKRGRFVVFIVDEIEDKFFFGGQVITELLDSINPEQKKELQAEGVPVEVYSKKSKNGMDYHGMTFYPAEAKTATEDDMPF